MNYTVILLCQIKNLYVNEVLYDKLKNSRETTLTPYIPC